MKLKFSIHYNTTWGQSLHVVITYISNDSYQKRYNLIMQTQDGALWELETAVMESRQHPISSFQYYYQVEDADGKVLRKEWDMIPRIYTFDSTKNYLFPDLWRDKPLQHHLYTNAYATAKGLQRGETVEATRLPLFRKSLIFRVSAPQLHDEEALAVCGDHPAIGNWNPSRYHLMNYIGNHEWMLSVNIEMIGLPFEYKYVVIDKKTNVLKTWEEGDNRSTGNHVLSDGQVLVLYGEPLRVREEIWRCAGISIPVFSLRSEHSYGVGDFGDLKIMTDWASQVGMKIIQLLPVNDTSENHSWTDSNPYNMISAFALHPHYLDIEQVGVLKNSNKMTVYHRQRNELNNLPYSDYEAVDRVKSNYIADIFEEVGKRTLSSKEYHEFFEANKDWLIPYAAYCMERDHAENEDIIYFVQYHLHVQLKEAAEYAQSKGIILKGDLPIGIYRNSVETKTHPEFFHLSKQMGTPPSNEYPNGQNWGFPSYDWSSWKDKKGIIDWFHRRLEHLSQYFDALRIDHIIGYFRSWEIPEHAISASLGHYTPSLPMSEEEIGQFGIVFRKDLFTHPFINDSALQKIFGIHANYVRDNFLIHKGYGLYDLKDDFNTQIKVRNHFHGQTDENSQWIRDGLYRLIANVLFIEDEDQPGMYHPRFEAFNTLVYETLSNDEQGAFLQLYNNYFYDRHNQYWSYLASQKLTELFGNTRMLICAEDLGMLPSCVEPLLDSLRILSLEIQSMPKSRGYEFCHLSSYPYRSVCSISTHDMPTLRLWWEENPGRTQRYFVTMLQKEGRAPKVLPAHIAEEIIGRHLYCPSMICILSLQDWLAMDNNLREKDVYEERINLPYDSYNQWKYRMGISIEKLKKASQFNNKIKTMIQRSQRL